MHILIVEDNEIDAEICSSFACSAGFKPTILSSADQAVTLLSTSKEPPLIIVIDLIMPGMSGLELIREIRGSNPIIRPFIIMITSNAHTETELKALEYGADDFIEKPIHGSVFKARLNVARRLIDAQTNLMKMALTDELTGLLNRRAALTEIEKNLSRLFRTNVPTEHSLIMCDIDHFKNINDTYGHAAGDIVLIEISRRLRESFRPFEIISRFGGEEFLIYCEAGRGDIKNILQRVKKNISELPVMFERHAVMVTLSIGCIVINNITQPLSCDTYIGLADDLLYKVKKTGRNNFSVALGKNKSSEPLISGLD